MTRTPQRVQLSRAKGWRKPEGAVVVARPTKWGNPFALERENAGATTMSRELVSGLYRQWITTKLRDDLIGGKVTDGLGRTGMQCTGPGRPWAPYAERPSIEEIQTELRGRDLACWCPLDQPCHADVLLELANAGATQ